MLPEKACAADEVQAVAAEHCASRYRMGTPHTCQTTDL